MSKDLKYWIPLIIAMTMPLVGAIFYFIVFSEDVFGKYIYSGIKIFLLLWPFICVYGIWKEKIPWPQFRNKAHGASLPLGVLTGVGILIFMIAAMTSPLGEYVYQGAESVRLKVQQLGVANHYILFSVFLSIIHSLIEEFYWRWFIFGSLRRRMTFLPAMLVSCAMFASHHIVVTTQFFSLGFGLFLGCLVGLGGAIWCWQLERQKSLCGAWASHGLVDLGVMAIGYVLLF